MNDFILILKEEIFEETAIDKLQGETLFRELDEWDSLSSMLLIGLADSEFNKTITGQEIESAHTIEDLFNLICK